MKIHVPDIFLQRQRLIIKKKLGAENVELNQLSQDRTQNPLQRKRALELARKQQPRRPRPWYSR